MKKLFATLAVCAPFAMMAVDALAAKSGAHFTNDSQCTLISSTTVSCTGGVAGLGGSATDAEANIESFCLTPKNKVIPGQTDTKSVTLDERSGRTNFTIVASASCPGNQTPRLGDQVDITFTDANGNIIFEGTLPIQ